MKGFVLTPVAARDVDEIWDYIAADNLAAADRVLRTLEAAMLKLSRSPRIGHVREDLADRRHRFFLVHSYLVVYRPSTSPLQVIRVLPASRDVQALLELGSE